MTKDHDPELEKFLDEEAEAQHRKMGFDTDRPKIVAWAVLTLDGHTLFHTEEHAGAYSDECGGQLVKLVEVDDG